MRKIRIKKDLSCVWRILTNGAPSALAGRDLTLYLVTPFARLRLAFATDGNACKFEVGHEVQGFTGIYSLELWENEGKHQQTIADLPEAFELVDLTTEEDDGTASDLEIAFLDLGTSSLAVGVGAEIIEDLRKELPNKQNAKMDKVYTSFATRDGFKGVNIYLLKGQAFDFNIEGSTKAKMIYPNGSGMEAPFPKVEDAHGNADGWHLIGGTSGTTKITISVKAEDEIRCQDARLRLLENK